MKINSKIKAGWGNLAMVACLGGAREAGRPP